MARLSGNADEEKNTLDYDRPEGDSGQKKA